MNIKEYKVPKILFIKSVFIKDCIPIDDIFEQQIIEQLSIEAPIITYEPIPSIFRSLSTWVKKTSIKCWYCDLNFDNSPVFIPTNIDKLSKPHTYSIGTHGCFCSFCCAVAYNDLHNQKICNNVGKTEMILYLFNIFNNKTVKYIKGSPSKYIMKQYGGKVESNVYRRMIKELSPDILESETKIYQNV
jgi:hypothetical protein